MSRVEDKRVDSTPGLEVKPGKSSGGRERFERLEGDAVSLHFFRKILVVHPGEAGGFRQLPLGTAQRLLDVSFLEEGYHPLLCVAERKIRVECRLSTRIGSRPGQP